MPGLGVSFLARRARSSWLLLACVAVTVLLATGLATVLWTFAVAAVRPGAERILAAPQGRVVGLSGVVQDAGGVTADSRVIQGTLRKAWPGTGYRMGSAVWANPVTLAPSRAVRAEASPVPGTPRPLEWQIQVGALDGIQAQTVLAAGRWPGPPVRGGPLPVALPVAVARLLRVVPGSVLRTATQSGPAAAGLRVTGLFRVRDPASPYWAMDLVPVSGFSASALPGGGIPGSLVVYGPAVVSPAAFGGGLAASEGSWFVFPSAAGLARQDIGVLAASTSQVVSKLATSIQPSGVQVSTRLLGVLAGIASTIVLARSLFAIGALALLLVAAAALVLAARLLASVRDEESALLRARGATRWQLMRPVLAEALITGAVAGRAGVLAGVRLAGPLAGLGGVRLDSDQATRVSPLAWLSALVMVAVCVAVLAWPALHAGTPDAARIRQGRQAQLAGIAWAGGDLAVVALAAIAVWQLRDYSAVAHLAAGSPGIDPVVAVAPALALAGVALIPLRILPLLARVTDRTADAGRRLAAAMVSWQIARRPIRQAGPVLLVVAATATSTLALAGYQSWHQSAADQAAFAVGSDVRVDGAAGVPVSTGTFTRTPEVTAATPASVTRIGNGSQLIALGTATADSAILLRPDLSAQPVRKLWRSVIPQRLAGLALPGRPDRLQILAALGAGPGTSAATIRTELGSATVTALLQNADGITYSLPAGVLPADSRRHALTVSLSGAPAPAAGRLPAAAAPPHAHLRAAGLRPGAAGAGRQPQHRVPRGPAHGARPVQPAVPRRCRPGVVAGRGLLAIRADRANAPGSDLSAAGRRGPIRPGLAARRRQPAAHVQYRARSGGLADELAQPRPQDHHRVGLGHSAVAATVRPGHRHHRLPGRRPAGRRIDRLGPGRRASGPVRNRGLGGQVPDGFRAEPGADR